MLPNVIEMLSKLTDEEQEQAYVILAAQYKHNAYESAEKTPEQIAVLPASQASSDETSKYLRSIDNRLGNLERQYEGLERRYEGLIGQLGALRSEVRAVKSEYSGLEAGLASLQKVGGPSGRGVLSVLNYADRSTLADRFIMGTYRDMLS